MEEEGDLHAKAGDLVKLLNSWRAPNVKKLPELIVDLAQLMADAGFWQQASPPVQHFQYTNFVCHTVSTYISPKLDGPHLDHRNASRSAHDVVKVSFGPLRCSLARCIRAMLT